MMLSLFVLMAAPWPRLLMLVLLEDVHVHVAHCYCYWRAAIVDADFVRAARLHQKNHASVVVAADLVLGAGIDVVFQEPTL